MIYLGLILLALSICAEGGSFIYAIYNMYLAFMGQKNSESIVKGHFAAMAGMVLSGIVGFFGWLCLGAEGIQYITQHLN